MSWLDKSGSVTLGGTAQTIMAANPQRMGLLIQNISDTDMWIDLGVTAVADQPSIKIVAGAYWESPPNSFPKGHVSLLCATTAKKFTAKEWNS